MDELRELLAVQFGQFGVRRSPARQPGVGAVLEHPAELHGAGDGLPAATSFGILPWLAPGNVGTESIASR